MDGVETNTTLDDELREKAQAFITAGHAFWEAKRDAGLAAAVHWLTTSDGQLLVYTRGEYRETIMSNIGGLIDEERFFQSAEVK